MDQGWRLSGPRTGRVVAREPTAGSLVQGADPIALIHSFWGGSGGAVTGRCGSARLPGGRCGAPGGVATGRTVAPPDGSRAAVRGLDRSVADRGARRYRSVVGLAVHGD
ncbi:hypothetical protein Acsp05_14330 [Actinokineospora sp. NBRC 105648]|nr:hypothetical protein Acsp05_14330 [Actinokineospora sp. NBRC 105648]